MTVFNVSSAAELFDALSSATGGDEILLAAGDYGDFSFSDANFSSEVVIRSSDSEDPAVFNTMTFFRATNVTLDGILLDFTPDADTLDHHAGLKVVDSSNITVMNSVFDGGPSVTDGEYIGRGIYFQDTDNIVITNNEVYNFRRGILTSDVDNVEISYNYVHDNRTTTLSGGDVDNMLIIGNHLSSSHPVNFGGAGDHGDFIHYWTMPDQEGPSNNIVIQDNFIEQGDGTALLGIYLDNNSNPQGFEDVVITNNVIHNGNGQGMRLEDVDGAVISYNTLIQTEGDYRKAPRIRLEDGTQNVVLENNIVSNTTAGKAMGDVSGNNIKESGTLVVQYDDPNAPNYVGDLIENGLVRDGDVDDFQTVKGTIAEGYGATLTSDQIAGGSNTNWNSSQDGGATKDEGSATDGSGDTDAGGETDAGAGSDAGSGAEAGSNDGGIDDSNAGDDAAPVDDSSEQNDATTDFVMNFDDFALDIAGMEADKTVRMFDDVKVEGNGLIFDGDGDYVKLGRLEQFEESEQIAFTIEFARDEADGSTQRLVWNHQKIGLSLTDDGLVVNIANNDGKFHDGFSIEDLGLNDTDVHRITVLADQNEDRLQVLVDDILVLDETETDLDFVGAGGREWGWMLGTAWGRDVDGTVTDFGIDDDVQFVDGPVVIEDMGLLG